MSLVPLCHQVSLPSSSFVDRKSSSSGGRCGRLIRKLRRNASDRNVVERLLMNHSSSTTTVNTSLMTSSGSKQSLAEDDKDEVHPGDPQGLCVDGEDNLMVVDRQPARVLLYRPDGRFLAVLLSPDHGLVRPRACGLSGTNTLSVTDEQGAVKTFSFF